MLPRVPRPRLTKIIILTTLSFSFLPFDTYAQVAENAPSSAAPSFKERFERLKKEISAIKTETDQDLQTIETLKEAMKCLDVVHHATTNLTRNLHSLSSRSEGFSFSEQASAIAKDHQNFFDALNDFSRASLTLVKKSDGTLVVDNIQLHDVLQRVALSVTDLAKRFEDQAAKEESILGKLSAKIVELNRAIYEADANIQSVQRCAPALFEKTQRLIADAKNASQTLSLSRSHVAELQKRRALFLGALSSSIQSKIVAQLAVASGQSADALLSGIQRTLAELQLHTEVERWWFKEVLENGPARGFLLGQNSNPLKAAEALTLAIATTDAYIAAANEQKLDTTSSRAQISLSALESRLYQRRNALGHWLSQANLSLQKNAAK